MFRELNLDHLVALQGAPNGSETNKVKRSMYVFILSLAHSALKQEKMQEWAEKEAKNSQSMKCVHELAKHIESRWAKA